jgi:two-component system sensor histidine kinase YcbA
VRSSGLIEIFEQQEGDSYVFSVRDDGPGIAEKNLTKIFQMGFSTKFDKQTGNIYRGVGLAGVKAAVEEGFHGKLEVRSALGAGTEFRITIPIASLEG